MISDDIKPTLDAMLAQNELITDIAHLSVDCLIRIVTGKSADPRADALATLRGCGMITSGDKCQS